MDIKTFLVNKRCFALRNQPIQTYSYLLARPKRCMISSLSQVRNPKTQTTYHHSLKRPFIKAKAINHKSPNCRIRETRFNCQGSAVDDFLQLLEERRRPNRSHVSSLQKLKETNLIYKFKAACSVFFVYLHSFYPQISREMTNFMSMSSRHRFDIAGKLLCFVFEALLLARWVEGASLAEGIRLVLGLRWSND